jgi:hypothetical protein
VEALTEVVAAEQVDLEPELGCLLRLKQLIRLLWVLVVLVLFTAQAEELPVGTQCFHLLLLMAVAKVAVKQVAM